MRPVVPSRVSQPFADPGDYASWSDGHGPAGHHTGVDFGSAWPIPINGRKVRAVLPGEVVISAFNAIMGHWVGVYNHEHNLLVTYWHLSERSVFPGNWVQVFQPVGRVGSTGNSTAPHLHVQVNRGRAFDYHGHIDPQIAFDVWKRRDARRKFKAQPVHPMN